VKAPIRLLATDIDGTLLNSEFRISDVDLAAIHRAHEEGIEVVLVTVRRHTFAFPIAKLLDFDSGSSAQMEPSRGRYLEGSFPH
jgi:hydroxymethylpyrimidine pyrophosphatase-like HAD family hydrolase